MSGKKERPKTTGNKARKTSRLKVIDQLLTKMEGGLSRKDPASIADYIRLLQLRQGMNEDEVKEVKVTWVEEAEQEDGSSTDRSAAKK